MKTLASSLFLLLVISVCLTSCSKSNTSNNTTTYPSTQGQITGNGATSFDISGAGSVFKKTADTVTIQATISTTANGTKQFILAMVAKSSGTVNFINAAANPFSNYTSGAVAFYTYPIVNSSGTLIEHEFLTSSGSVNITSFSATGISGSYTANLSDVNNNGDAAITITGNFSGSF